jgi:diguanylate cyclase (GGDEF)-like protein/putative nucleotidyltransferase with HDIG domain
MKKFRAILPATATVAILTAALLVWAFGPLIAIVIIPVLAAAAYGYWSHERKLEGMAVEAEEVQRIHMATIEALATAIDARDQVGIGHVRRTQIYAVGIGQLLDLSAGEIEALRTGALLHDIGKLAIPDHILNKPGKLTPSELEKTKIHPVVGAEILAKVGFQYPVVPTVKFHHESWNGKGYPHGLAGEDIPLTARILCVADAYDTLRGARPYRPALSRDKARQVMQAEAGTRFDPTLVSVLLRNLSGLEEEVVAAGLGYETHGTNEAFGDEGSYAEKIKLANQEVFNLYELAREFSAAGSLEETFKLFADDLTKFVPFGTCAIYLLDSAKRAATAVHVSGDDAKVLEGRKLRVGQGATGYALRSGETVKNVEPDLDFAHSQVELLGKYQTLASVPLRAGKDIVGAVTIYSANIVEYGDEHIRLLETISRIAAEAIGKSLQHDEVKAHALTDPLTGLPNARSLQMQFDKEIARANRGGSSFQVLMLDLDGFKAVNDSFGHKVGDDLLTGVGQIIKGQLRDYDFMARYGGDEFIALIPETTTQDVADLCGRIEKAVRDFKIDVGGGRFAGVGVSVGSAGYPSNGDTLDTLIVAADKVMYMRKSNRKRRAAFDIVDTAAQADDTDNNAPLIVELDESHVISSSAIN